jgi:hypothetical protein
MDGLVATNDGKDIVVVVAVEGGAAPGVTVPEVDGVGCLTEELGEDREINVLKETAKFVHGS